MAKIAVALMVKWTEIESSFWVTPFQMAEMTGLTMGTVGTIGNNFADVVQEKLGLKVEYAFKAWIVHWPIGSDTDKAFNMKEGSAERDQAHECWEKNRRPAKDRAAERESRGRAVGAMMVRQQHGVVQLHRSPDASLEAALREVEAKNPEAAKAARRFDQLRMKALIESRKREQKRESEPAEKPRRGGGGGTSPYMEYVTRGMLFVNVFEEGDVQFSTTAAVSGEKLVQLDRFSINTSEEEWEDMLRPMIRRMFRAVVDAAASRKDKQHG